jgi:hypothetical protein
LALGWQMCAVLDRKRGKLASAAVSAYADIVRKTDHGALKYRFSTGVGAPQHQACDLLRRALQIGRAIGWDKPETIAARGLVANLRKRAVEKRTLVPIIWFCNLDLDFSVSESPRARAFVPTMSWADTTNAHGRLMLTVLGGLAEFEHELIRTRTGEGRARAVANGVKMGRKPKLTDHQSARRSSDAIKARRHLQKLDACGARHNRRPELSAAMSNLNKNTPDDEVPKGLRGGRAIRAVLNAAGGAIPFIGGIISAGAGAWSEQEQEKINTFFEHWLKILQDEMAEKAQTILEIMARLDMNDEKTAERVASPEYQSLVRKDSTIIMSPVRFRWAVLERLFKIPNPRLTSMRSRRPQGPARTTPMSYALFTRNPRFYRATAVSTLRGEAQCCLAQERFYRSKGLVIRGSL